MHALDHVKALALGMPSPVEASRATYGTDARLAAFFASPERMSQVFGADRTLFEYLAYDEKTVTDLSEISKLGPMVLSVESAEPLVVNCVMGTLRLAYGSASIATDAGQPVSAEQLKQASIEYWAEWSAKHRGNT